MSNGIDPSREDDAIVRAALTDIDAFEPLYQKYNVPIYRWMYRETRDPDTAADFTAQTFVQAIHHLRSYKPERATSFRAWLFAIARNLLRDSWRRYRPQGAMPELTDASPGPEEIAIHRSVLDELHLAMQHLPGRQAEIIELRLAGLTIREIADIQGTSEDATKTAQARAFTSLRKHMGQKVTI